MASAAELVVKARKWNRSHIKQHWKALSKDVPISGWAPGKAFEHLILRAFEIEGADVTWPYEVHAEGHTIEQIDGAVHFKGLACLVESKDWDKKIDFGVIAKLKAQLARRPGTTLGLVFGSRGYTDPAGTLARFLPPANVLLWEKDDVNYALSKGAMLAGLAAKHRYAIEHGFPDYNLIAEGIYA